MSDQPTGKPAVAMMVADDELFPLATSTLLGMILR